jgi:hypothetical protein
VTEQQTRRDDAGYRAGPLRFLAHAKDRRSVVLAAALVLLVAGGIVLVGMRQGQSPAPGLPEIPPAGQAAGGDQQAEGGQAAGGGDQPADGPAAGGDQAGGGAQAAGGAPGAASGPSSGGSAGAIPPECQVPGDRLEIRLESSEWQEDPEEISGGYQLLLVNGTDRQICMFLHYASQDSRNDPAGRPPNAWSTSCEWQPEGGSGATPELLATAEFWRELSVPGASPSGDGGGSPGCYFDYPDRWVAVYYGDCVAALKARLDAVPSDQRGAVLDPYAWELPVLGRAQGFSCP